MAIPDNKIQVSMVISRDYHKKIQKYAAGIGLSESRFMANILELAVDDNEWLFKAMTSTLGRRLRSVMGSKDDPERVAREERKAAKRSAGSLPEMA